MDRKQKYMIIAACLITIIAVSSTTLFASSVSGYQSITGEWNEIKWQHTWYDWTDWQKVYPHEIDYQEFVNDSVIRWDGNDAAGVVETVNHPDWNGISAEIENPKFDRNIDYYDWWVNDTVTATNPTGAAQHFEWAIDIYTVNVNFIVLDGIHWYENPEFWAHFQNNYESVFSNLGAEKAVSYVIYAQTSNYTKNPDNAPHAIITPTTGNFKMHFLDTGTETSPSAPEEGSKLDFESLSRYSHVAIKFTLADFGTGAGETRPSVNLVVELNVLTIGRFDYVLTYVAGGSNDVAPIGGLGFFDGIGAALAAGWGALMDGFVSLADALVAPLIAIAVIVGCVVVIFIVLKRGGEDG